MLTANRSSQLMGVTLLLAVALLLFYAAVPALVDVVEAIPPPVSDHAVEKHGTAAIKAASCIERPDAHVFFNKDTQRFGYACIIGSRWAVAFTTEDGNPITSFFKEKLKSLDQIVRYMDNTGYVP